MAITGPQHGHLLWELVLSIEMRRWKSRLLDRHKFALPVANEPRIWFSNFAGCSRFERSAL